MLISMNRHCCVTILFLHLGHQVTEYSEEKSHLFCKGCFLHKIIFIIQYYTSKFIKYVYAMGRVTNAQKAAQTRQRRAKKKEKLQILYELSIREGATEKSKSTYRKARKFRESFLRKERLRVQKYRNELKKRAASKDTLALEKTARTKEKKHMQYITNKKLGKRKQ